MNHIMSFPIIFKLKVEHSWIENSVPEHAREHRLMLICANNNLH